MPKLSEYGDMIQRDLGSAGAGFTNPEIEGMSREEVFAKWLEWNGIIGYAEMILEAVAQCGITVVAPGAEREDHAVYRSRG